MKIAKAICWKESNWSHCLVRSRWSSGTCRNTNKPVGWAVTGSWPSTVDVGPLSSVVTTPAKPIRIRTARHRATAGLIVVAAKQQSEPRQQADAHGTARPSGHRCQYGAFAGVPYVDIAADGSPRPPGIRPNSYRTARNPARPRLTAFPRRFSPASRRPSHVVRHLIPSGGIA